MLYMFFKMNTTDREVEVEVRVPGATQISPVPFTYAVNKTGVVMAVDTPAFLSLQGKNIATWAQLFKANDVVI